MPTGEYIVISEAPGFATINQSGLVLRAGQTAFSIFRRSLSPEASGPRGILRHRFAHDQALRLAQAFGRASQRPRGLLVNGKCQLDHTGTRHIATSSPVG